MSVTVKDVARVAGVSTATVSRALRGFDTVDPAIRQHVQQVADRLNYVASPAAAALSTGRAGSIGVITPFVNRMAFQRMLAGIESAMRGTEMDLLLYCTGDPSDPHPVPPRKRLARRVDGFLVLSLSLHSPDVEEIAKLNMPVVSFGEQGPWGSNVQIDDRASAATATEHLLDLGHTRIGVIYGREAQDPAVLEYQRHLGFHDAMSRSGREADPNLIAPGDFTIAGGSRAMEQLLDADAPPSAVFAFSDEMAYGALRVLRDRDLIPGRDVAIIGFDGHETSALLELSTISVPFEEIGAATARRLIAEISGVGMNPAGATVLPTELTVRASTRRA
ncbi:MAG: LacI family transcriptional regulator [Microbacterium sp.]|uniref:LacI family DNA-binding transcriptional regulator n=1 Tax=unclassified Microbacterium TaxID=2609290 RepID=UPI000DB7F45E|nr:LacI family DNA-binding transcriptional regulator [Microbacterium sp.]PZU37832.1 MAG: LacI family transcriptional regulator [Microbacterium sp.]